MTLVLVLITVLIIGTVTAIAAWRSMRAGEQQMQRDLDARYLREAARRDRERRLRRLKKMSDGWEPHVRRGR